MVGKLGKAVAFVRSVLREAAAERAAEAIKKKLKIVEAPEVALVLGTGWGDALKLAQERSLPFQSLPGFTTLGQLTGHKRRVIYGYLGKAPVIVLSGRVHANEDLFSKDLLNMVRLQVEMLIKLGVRQLILTCAAGGLPASGRPVQVADLVAIDGFLSVLANNPMPLYAGEFYSADDVISEDLLKTALRFNRRRLLKVREGGYAYVRGPGFEGRKYDKGFISQAGVSAVGMSVLPEAYVCALYRDLGVKILPVAFITNSAIEEHSHVENIARAKDKSKHLGAFLKYLVDNISE
jgi:purine-nucleoside phosphorylase